MPQSELFKALRSSSNHSAPFSICVEIESLSVSPRILGSHFCTASAKFLLRAPDQQRNTLVGIEPLRK